MKPQYVLPFERKIVELEDILSKLESQPPTPATLEAIRNMRVEIANKKREIFDNLNPWETVQVSRHQDRPQARDYIELVCDEFIELHGIVRSGTTERLTSVSPRSTIAKCCSSASTKGEICKKK